MFLKPAGGTGGDHVIESLIGHEVDHEHVNGKGEDWGKENVLGVDRFVFEILFDGFFENEKCAEDREHRRGEHGEHLETSCAIGERRDRLRRNKQWRVALAGIGIVDLLPDLAIVTLADPLGEKSCADEEKIEDAQRAQGLQGHGIGLSRHGERHQTGDESGYRDEHRATRMRRLDQVEDRFENGGQLTHHPGYFEMSGESI